jgi:hypothetical protein
MNTTRFDAPYPFSLPPTPQHVVAALTGFIEAGHSDHEETEEQRRQQPRIRCNIIAAAAAAPAPG